MSIGDRLNKLEQRMDTTRQDVRAEWDAVSRALRSPEVRRLSDVITRRTIVEGVPLEAAYRDDPEFRRDVDEFERLFSIFSQPESPAESSHANYSNRNPA
jgi:hypothetical protein